MRSYMTRLLQVDNPTSLENVEGKVRFVRRRSSPCPSDCGVVDTRDPGVLSRSEGAFMKHPCCSGCADIGRVIVGSRWYALLWSIGLLGLVRL